MHTILGAGGAVANELAKVLIAIQQTVTLVDRTPKSMTSASIFSAVLTTSSETSEAVKGASSSIYVRA